MKIYVIRHGESENNLKGKWTGWFDAPLTEKGMDDARAVGEVIRGIRFDKIYSSDLSRAVNTARLAIPGCEPELSAQLREIDIGDLANKPQSVLSGEELDQVFKYGYARFGGETNEQFFGRVTSFAKELESSGCDTVAVFTHAGWLRRMLNFVIGVNMPRKSVVCNNCALGIFEYENGIWRMYSWLNVT